MGIQDIRELNRAVPFHPYTIRLVSGVTHQVPHPDFVAIAPRGSWVMVSDDMDHPHWISALLIEEVSPTATETQSGR